MTFLTWLPLATVCVLGALSPGPSLALVINNTVQRGTATGLRTALGHGIGVALYALITAMGLGLLISQTPWLFDGIKYAGAAFLVYMAIKILLAKPDAEGQSAPSKTRFVGFGGGFMVAFLNPKLAIFFLALFSQFVRADLTLGDQLLMMATAGGIDALWYAAVALGIGRTGLLGWLQRHGIWVDRVSAVIFLLLATAVVLQ
ncbi:LysE family translocator [Ferrimonas kyonanensis]|uniref:LysE family translocator n=1 Tax=Ferrimonas kyonanensis TaxID=364763 RepID=UPI0004807FAC|nr:LysE family translocator [Ferrimonas kyonanensis]